MQWKKNEVGIACDSATKSYICNSSDVIQYKRLQVQFSTQATACCTASFTSCQLVHVADSPGGQVPQRLPTEPSKLPPVRTVQLPWPPHCSVTHYQPISTPLVTSSVCMQEVCEHCDGVLIAHGVTHYQPISTPLVMSSVCMQEVCAVMVFLLQCTHSLD